MLVRAFLNGQVHLLEEPGPAILALEDPYDPEQNRATGPCMMRESLQGPSSISILGCTSTYVSFALPPDFWRTRFGTIGNLVFSILGLLAIAVFIFDFWRLCAHFECGVVPLGILLIGLGNVFAFGQRGVQLYQTAIYCGVAWMMWTLVLLQRAFSG